MPKKLIWVDVRNRRDGTTPTYYFDFDYLNTLGFQDKDMLDFLEDMRIFAKKEIEERSGHKVDI